MRVLQNLHEGFSRVLSTTLTSYLRTLIEVELVSVDQLTYNEFVMSVTNPSCIYIFQMEPLTGNAIFEINPSLVFFMIDRLFGGPGQGHAVQPGIDRHRTFGDEQDRRAPAVGSEGSLGVPGNLPPQDRELREQSPVRADRTGVGNCHPDFLRTAVSATRRA
jgi:hypothetical protein